VTVTFEDRFAGDRVSMAHSGTGVAQALHLVATVLLSPPRRILLIDEPHVYLHPGAERTLVGFLRDHPEHSYVCATHSPVFINAAKPERCWLVTRDEAGTRMRSVFNEGLARQHILLELGIHPGDVALAERIVFVEGPSDEDVYPILLRRLGWDPIMRNCAVIRLDGAGTATPLAKVLDELANVLHTTFTVILDGDQRDSAGANPHVRFLDVDELEDLFLADPEAVQEGLLRILKEEQPEQAENVLKKWPIERVRAYINDRGTRDPNGKASKVLIDLAWEMGTTYRKHVHGPAIANALNDTIIEQLRGTFADFFDS
jgi:predicted ATP-dependent endonuclease of OLD family